MLGPLFMGLPGLCFRDQRVASEAQLFAKQAVRQLHIVVCTFQLPTFPQQFPKSQQRFRNIRQSKALSKLRLVTVLTFQRNAWRVASPHMMSPWDCRVVLDAGADVSVLPTTFADSGIPLPRKSVLGDAPASQHLSRSIVLTALNPHPPSPYSF